MGFCVHARAVRVPLRVSPGEWVQRACDHEMFQAVDVEAGSVQLKGAGRSFWLSLTTLDRQYTVVTR